MDMYHKSYQVKLHCSEFLKQMEKCNFFDNDRSCSINCILLFCNFPFPVAIASSAQLSSQGVYPPSPAQEDELAAEVCVVQ